jgi:hypothetical protein
MKARSWFVEVQMAFAEPGLALGRQNSGAGKFLLLHCWLLYD